MRTLLIRLRTALVRLGFAIGRRRPVRPRLVLATSHSLQLTGNLRAIADELARRDPAVPVVTLASRVTAGLPGIVAGIVDALLAGYHLATARLFVVDDYFFPMYVIRPRRGTARVQTWHAAGAFKKVGYSVLDKSFGADESLVGQVRIHSNYDLCLMPSDAATVHYMDAFRQPRERFSAALGLPRTDLFFDASRRASAEAAISERYTLPPDRRILLYAPTFRGDTMHAARYDDSLDLDAMRQPLGDTWIVLLRLHPFVRRSVTIGPALAPFVRDVSNWPDMNELMFVADLLVTDYSSAIFEFALLGRPMAFLAPDADAYERERGFYLDFRRDMPGPIFATTEALATWIASGDLDPTPSIAFARRSFDVADGHATERFVDRVVLPALQTGRIDVAALAQRGDAPAVASP
ncbi:MAG TPA: CDP-glycerol glycerophosphotransferase family protein [Candidatus Limnocylindrales bacterium]|nr:CDP-glycerol glycerophosphotransferase family protein [Candidatus Limnocylindrales bacterium]